MKTLFHSGLAILAGTAICSAQIVIETDGTNAANLTKITIDGTEYTSFIGVSVDAFSMYTGSNQTFQVVPSGTGIVEGQAALDLMTDSSLSSGYAALVNDTFSFDAPVTNGPGAEIFIFEYDSSESNELNVTLNGQTINIGNSPFTATGSTVNVELNFNSSQRADSISALLAMEFQFSKNVNNSSIGYHAIDLSDYGVAPGGTVSEINLAGSSDWDITSVVGINTIPEPSHYALLATACLGALIMLRRRRC